MRFSIKSKGYPRKLNENLTMIDLAKRFPTLAPLLFMKYFSGLIALLFAFSWSSTVLAQAYSPLNRLGTNEAICVGGIQTVEELQAVFVNDSETIAEVLANSAWQGDKADLDAAIAGPLEHVVPHRGEACHHAAREAKLGHRDVLDAIDAVHLA